MSYDQLSLNVLQKIFLNNKIQIFHESMLQYLAGSMEDATDFFVGKRQGCPRDSLMLCMYLYSAQYLHMLLCEMVLMEKLICAHFWLRAASWGTQRRNVHFTRSYQKRGCSVLGQDLGSKGPLKTLNFQRSHDVVSVVHNIHTKKGVVSRQLMSTKADKCTQV